MKAGSTATLIDGSDHR